MKINERVLRTGEIQEHRDSMVRRLEGGAQLPRRAESSRLEWKGPLAVALMSMLILFVRMPDRLIHGFLWAEDGKIFLEQAYDYGISSFTIPYAGYFHFLPRLIAFVFSRVSVIGHAALLFAWTSALILSAMCAYLFAFARKMLPSPAAWAFGLTPVLIPHSGEVWLSITNLQWVIAPALLILLWDEFCSFSSRPPGLKGDAIRGVAIVLMTLTGPFGVLFLPIVVVGLLATRRVPRSNQARFAIAAFFIAVTIQIVSIMVMPTPHMTPGEPPHHLLDYLHFPWGSQFLHFFVLGFPFSEARIDMLGQKWIAAAMICMVIMIGCCLFSGKEAVLACVGLTAVALGLWMVGIIRTNNWSGMLSWHAAGGRYFYVPFVLMTWALIVSLATTRYYAVKLAALCFLALVMINSISQFKPAPIPQASIIRDTSTGGWILSVPPGGDWNIKLGNKEGFEPQRP